MGYTTDFWGKIDIEPPLSPEEAKYLEKFAHTRRMLRGNGPYFIGGTGSFGQGDDPDILNHNTPPMGQPGLWNHWVPTENGDGLEWDESEKFYDSAKWMLYLIQHFLAPNAIAVGKVPGVVGGHVLNGTIDAQGEDTADKWKLIVKDNIVYTKRGRQAKERVESYPYELMIYGDRLKNFFIDSFGIKHPALDDPLARISIQIPTDPETGLPTKNLYIYSHGDIIASYLIGPDGKAYRAGTLEWIPEQE